jgi:hypothetical protein
LNKIKQIDISLGLYFHKLDRSNVLAFTQHKAIQISQITKLCYIPLMTYPSHFECLICNVPKIYCKQLIDFYSNIMFHFENV